MTSLEAAPPVSSLELTRMRRDVKAKLFGTPGEPIRIGRYRIRGTLGHGGMGIVHLAVDEDLGREVAIKLLRPEIGTDGSRRLASEAKSLARLSHPNVVGVFDVGEHEGRRFIAMEYVPGETLRGWLERTHSMDEVLEVFRQAGEGLAAAHAVGLVHRDFKPDNVLVGTDGRARVLDFGLARPPDPRVPGQERSRTGSVPAVDEVDPLATSLTRAGALLGTPAYMAPEQHLGDPAGPASDQFAYGIALHDAVYGHRPFVGEDLRTLSLSIVAGKRQPVSTAGPFGPVPPKLAALIDRTLATDPANRFASMNDLLSALAQLGAGMGASGSRAGNESKPQEFETREFEAAFGLDQSDNHGELPTLDRHELAAVADEVGIEVQALATQAVELVDGSAPVERRTTISGEVPVVVLNRELATGVQPRLAPALSRLLDRAFGSEGRHEMIGSNYVWSSPAGEVTVAPHLRGATLVLESRLNEMPALRQSRTRWWALFGFLFGVFVTVADGVDEPEIFLIWFIFTMIGFTVGRLTGRRTQRKAIAERRERLQQVADRIAALNQSPIPADPTP